MDIVLIRLIKNRSARHDQLESVAQFAARSAKTGIKFDRNQCWRSRNGVINLGLWLRLTEYAKNHVRLLHAIFDRLAPHFPQV